jgi:hypothetical protein
MLVIGIGQPRLVFHTFMIFNNFFFFFFVVLVFLFLLSHDLLPLLDDVPGDGADPLVGALLQAVHHFSDFGFLKRKKVGTFCSMYWFYKYYLFYFS